MQRVVGIIERLQATSSTNEKEMILKENKDNELLKKVLFYTYHPHKKYKVTEKTIEETSGSGISRWKDVFEMLEELSKSNINDKLRRDIVEFLYNEDSLEITNLYMRMLLKDLRCNISEKTVNKVWKGLIPTHEVMLASKFEGVLKGQVAITTKMDGLRCSAIIDNNEVTWVTRQGKIIEGLNELSSIILKATEGRNGFIDGELLALNPEGLNSGELFRKTTKIVNSKLEDKKGITFVMFDYLTEWEYKNKKCIGKYRARRICIYNIKHRANNELIDIVKSHGFTENVEEVYKLLTKVTSQGEEGLMLNYVDAVYEFKRSKTILKVKEFFTADLKVIGMEEGTGRNKGRLGALVVDYKGYEVKVGSGFSDEDRDNIWSDKGSVMDKVIEVKFFEESKNEKGGISLRFPTFVRIREEGKEVSYN